MRPYIPSVIRSSAQRYSYPLGRQSKQLRSYRSPFLTSPHLRTKTQFPSHWQIPVTASYNSYILVLIVACSSAIAYEYLYYKPDSTSSEPAPPPVVEVFPQTEDERTPAYHKMAIPEGSLGNLTAHQEAKLREFWALTLKTFGVTDSDGANPPTTPPTTTAVPVHTPQTPQETPKRRRLGGLFSRGKHEDDTPGSPASTTTNEDDDKWGQTAELHQILKTQSAESLRATFWEMVKSDHPDALLLRFLRARKWDVDKGLAMLVSTMNWRRTQMRVDEDIMLQGEGGALADSKGADAGAKKEGHDFLAQLRMGKSFLHGTDKEGRPITYVRARLHKGGEQTEKSLERYTVYVIETARLLLTPPVETACIVFDMTSFTLQNMDYTPVKFMIKVFEANYPESLGAVLVHKAPWIFQGIWKIIKGWLDPVVAAKVHFTNSVDDMEAFIPKNHIIKELGGTEDWEYKYIESIHGENDRMKDTTTRDELQAERTKDVQEYQAATFRWLAAAAKSTDEAATVKAERDALAKKLKDNYWQLDAFVRARSIYDRVGMIQKDGKVDFYPKHTLKAENVNGSAAVNTDSSKVSADDDVD